MLNTLLLTAHLLAPSPEPLALSFPRRGTYSLRAPVTASRSRPRSVKPGRRDIVAGSIMLGLGVPLLALGTAGVISVAQEPEVGWFVGVPSIAAIVTGAILTPVGAVRIARGVKERRGMQGMYVFAPGRGTLGLGATGRF